MLRSTRSELQLRRQLFAEGAQSAVPRSWERSKFVDAAEEVTAAVIAP